MTTTPERIAACLAACEGIPTEDLEGCTKRIIARVEELREALQGLVDNIRHNKNKGVGVSPLWRARKALGEIPYPPACLVEAIREARDCEPSQTPEQTYRS
jgi:hypothetical protein